MFKLKMMFPTFIMWVLLIGIEVKANPFNHCVEMMSPKELENLVKLDGEDRFKVFCENMTGFFTCIDDELKEQTGGYNMSQAAEMLKSYAIGKALRVLVNIKELVEDICTEGSELNEGYLSSIACYQNMSRESPFPCDEQIRNVSEIFKVQQTGRRGQKATDEACVIAAYQMGCLGTNIEEKCGEQGFHVFKEVIKKIGIFKSGLCSPSIIQMIKTTLMDSLDMENSRKTLYRTIVELRRRKR